jgi:hypothetical protein
MIKTDRQRSIALRRIAQFERAVAVAELKQSENEEGRQKLALYVVGLRSNIESFNREVVEYDALKAGDESIIKIDSVTDLIGALPKYRILRGWTQEKLARELGVRKQQVQRWERFEYQTAAAFVVSEVASLLGVRIARREERTAISAAETRLQPVQWPSVEPAFAGLERGNAVGNFQRTWGDQGSWNTSTSKPVANIGVATSYRLIAANLTEHGAAPAAQEPALNRALRTAVGYAVLQSQRPATDLFFKNQDTPFLWFLAPKDVGEETDPQSLLGQFV